MILELIDLLEKNDRLFPENATCGCVLYSFEPVLDDQHLDSTKIVCIIDHSCEKEEDLISVIEHYDYNHETYEMDFQKTVGLSEKEITEELNKLIGFYSIKVS